MNHYKDSLLIENFSKIKNFKFEIFSKEIHAPYQVNNIKLFPINKELFNHSLINCHGLITGAGFETPAEALYMGKKLMVFPLKGQYEQQCNARALEEFNAVSLNGFDEEFPKHFENWIAQNNICKLTINNTTEEIISKVVNNEIESKFDTTDCQEFEPNLEIAL